MKYKIYIITTILGLLAWSADGIAEIKLSNPVVKDIGQAYGFYLAQKNSLTEISKKYPTLSGLAFIAEKEFLASFESSIQGMDAIMIKHAENTWQKIKNHLVKQISDFNNIDQVTESQARQFIEIVRQRAKGNIESPILETFLLFKSGYENNPEHEFLDGYKYKYTSDGSGKAKGVAFSIESPKTWAAQEGNRPNVVQKFLSENGRGLEGFLILIKEIPMGPGEKISEKDVSEMLNPKEINNFLPDGAIHIKSGKLNLENLPGFWMHYKMNMSRVKNLWEFEVSMYAIFYKNKMIQIQGQVATSVNGKTINSEGLRRYEKLFDLIANSLVITNMYQ